MHRVRKLTVSLGLIVIGIAMMSYPIVELTLGSWLERRDREQFRAQIEVNPRTTVPEERLSNVVPISIPRRDAKGQGVLPIGLATVAIERLGMSVLVRPGTTAAELKRGAGWIAGTARPGEDGNVGIAGHRDTFFRGLRHIRIGDRVTLQTPERTQVYLVREMQIVEPWDTSPLGSSRGTLTLVTCYPFGFVGAAPQRFIVRAVRQ